MQINTRNCKQGGKMVEAHVIGLNYVSPLYSLDNYRNKYKYNCAALPIHLLGDIIYNTVPFSTQYYDGCSKMHQVCPVGLVWDQKVIRRLLTRQSGRVAGLKAHYD